MSRAVRLAVALLACAPAVGCEEVPPDGRLPPVRLQTGFTDVSGALADAFPHELLKAFDVEWLREPENSTVFAADVDGDGRLEVVAGFSDHAPARLRRAATYLAGADGRLVEKGLLGTAPATREWPAAAILDLDGDGAVDLVTGRTPYALAWGRGGGAFDDPVMLGDSSQLASAVPALGLADVDSDGWLDLVYTNRFCGLPDARVFYRTGPREFAERPEVPEGAAPGAWYAVGTAALSPGTEPWLFTIGQSCSAIEPPLFFAPAGLDDEGYPRFRASDLVPTDAIFRRSTGPTAPLSLFTPMGASIDDLDDDGQLDLVVSIQGLIVLQGKPTLPWADRTTVLHDGMRPGEYMRRQQIPWGVSTVDFDRDGLKDVLFTAGKDSGAWEFGPDFEMHVALGLGAGPFSFADATAGSGLERKGQWRSLAVTDLEGDGDADVLVGGQGEPPRVYRNDITGRGNGFSLRLRGTTSNANGTGAHVEVLPAGGGARRRYFAGGTFSPYVVSEPLVFAGLGSATRADEVRITWPSGLVQVVRGLEAGRLHEVVEPRVLEVLPASRRLPADGASVAKVVVRPAGEDGAPLASATVTARVTHGPGTAAVARGEDGLWTVSLTAPEAPGASVVEVSVDGRALHVRPRIRWDGR